MILETKTRMNHHGLKVIPVSRSLWGSPRKCGKMLVMFGPQGTEIWNFEGSLIVRMCSLKKSLCPTLIVFTGGHLNKIGGKLKGSVDIGDIGDDGIVTIWTPELACCKANTAV